MDDIEKVKVIAKGNVQGVGYRSFCTGKASALGITGYAKNLADGSVEIVAEGRRDNIRLFLKRVESFEGASSLEIVEMNSVSERAYEDFKTLTE